MSGVPAKVNSKSTVEFVCRSPTVVGSSGVSRPMRLGIVGMSPNADRPSFEVASHMQSLGYDIVPINPAAAGKTILGLTCLSSLEEATAPMDVCVVFRASEFCPEVARQAVTAKAALGLKVLWMQTFQDITDSEHPKCFGFCHSLPLMLTKFTSLNLRAAPVALRAFSATPFWTRLWFEEEGKEAPLFKTALHDMYQQEGGKMVPFAGYLLPVQFPAGVLTSHLHTRAADCASVFDVGHMGQIRWYGKDAQDFLETVVVGDLASLKVGEARLSLITNEKGGIIDDTVITKFDGFFSMVVNGSTKFGDMKHFNRYLDAFTAVGRDVRYEYLHEQNLIALQGDGSQRVLESLTSDADLSRMPFMSGRFMKVAGKDCLVTRCGYTGEDGFEISMSWNDAVAVATAVGSQKNVLPAGLGARDSLRLEAGLCLYGNDLNETITPIEAGLAWTIGKRRRTGAGANFTGSSVVLSQLASGSWTKRRVGLAVQDKAPARPGTLIFDKEGKEIGAVTSGTISPCLKRPVAMAYVNKGFHEIGSEVFVEIRNKRLPAVVEKMPFVPTRYYHPK